ncbi:hypothetical protein BG004_002318 [Podila humilis]|nr:hypothetical protein BG004_002318 [Podila humilis]
MSGNIHFVTPTNRWIGSIPLSTLDPLTLEPLSTYLRHGASDTYVPEDDINDKDSTSALEEHLDRTTNMTAGDPVSLILARLQTTPHGCACGCTIPAPPRHSDYYHAQHLLRLLFQQQRIRARSIKHHLPQYFDRLTESDDDITQNKGSSENNNSDVQETSSHTHVSSSSTSSVVIRMDTEAGTARDTQAGPTTITTTTTERKRHKKKRKQRTPKWVHSLIQNRAVRNPLTNTETQGDPTFFVVLEAGKGGWWYEPWVMSTRPSSMDGITQQLPRHHHLPYQHQHHHREAQEQQKEQQKEQQASSKAPATSETTEPTPEMLQIEKELRKERWRLSRICNLEIESQHELDWRRWQRSLSMNLPHRPGSGSVTTTTHGTNKSRRRKPSTRIVRFKIGKDMTLLEPSENDLRLPRRIRNRRNQRKVEKKEKEKGHFVVECNNSSSGGGGGGHTPQCPVIQATAVLNELELEDVRQQRQQEKQQEQHQTEQRQPSENTLPKAKQSLPAFTMPWWEPDPKPFVMPNTKLSPFSISTLPEPVATLFGGKSIYAASPRPKPSHEQQQKSHSVRMSSDVAASPSSSSSSSPSDVHGIGATFDDACAGTDQPHPSRNIESAVAATAAAAVVAVDTNPAPSSSANNKDEDTATISSGPKWIPVKDGDRIAVMIGTTQDFLLFPSFQRLFLRHLSKEDFQDRVGRVTVIPCPVTTVVVEGRHAQDRSGRIAHQQRQHASEEEDEEEEEDLERGRRRGQGSRNTTENDSFNNDDHRAEFGTPTRTSRPEAAVTPSSSRRMRVWTRWISTPSRSGPAPLPNGTEEGTRIAHASSTRLAEDLSPGHNLSSILSSSGLRSTAAGQSDIAMTLTLPTTSLPLAPALTSTPALVPGTGITSHLTAATSASNADANVGAEAEKILDTFLPLSTASTASSSSSQPEVIANEKPLPTIPPQPHFDWQFDWETYLREDYDSSEYSFFASEYDCSDPETRDALCYYSESTSTSTSSSSSYDDDDSDVDGSLYSSSSSSSVLSLSFEDEDEDEDADSTQPTRRQRPSPRSNRRQEARPVDDGDSNKNKNSDVNDVNDDDNAISKDVDSVENVGNNIRRDY